MSPDVGPGFFASSPCASRNSAGTKEGGGGRGLESARDETLFDRARGGWGFGGAGAGGGGRRGGLEWELEARTEVGEDGEGGNTYP